MVERAYREVSRQDERARADRERLELIARGNAEARRPLAASSQAAASFPRHSAANRNRTERLPWRSPHRATSCSTLRAPPSRRRWRPRAPGWPAAPSRRGRPRRAFSLGDLRNSPLAEEPSSRRRRRPNSYVDFEAMVLQTFVQIDAAEGRRSRLRQGHGRRHVEVDDVAAARHRDGRSRRHRHRRQPARRHYLRRRDHGRRRAAFRTAPRRTGSTRSAACRQPLVQEMQRRLTSDIARRDGAVDGRPLTQSTPRRTPCSNTRSSTASRPAAARCRNSSPRQGRQPQHASSARIEQAVDEETASIRTDMNYDLKASNARKSRYLYELSRAMKGARRGAADRRTARSGRAPARQARRTTKRRSAPISTP